MQSREEPLTRRERAELQGYVSWSAVIGRAVLFAIAVAAVGAVSWRLQNSLRLPSPVWLIPTTAVAVLLFVRARRWTGGRDLRNRIRLDLQSNVALVHHVTVRDAIVFEEQEDEGPVVFVLTDAGETLAFTGQDLSRHVAHGFPWREFEIRESGGSRRFLGLRRRGEKFKPSAIRPPIAPERYRQLGLHAVSRWKQLDVPFETLTDPAAP